MISPARRENSPSSMGGTDNRPLCGSRGLVLFSSVLSGGVFVFMLVKCGKKTTVPCLRARLYSIRSGTAMPVRAYLRWRGLRGRPSDETSPRDHWALRPQASETSTSSVTGRRRISEGHERPIVREVTPKREPAPVEPVRQAPASMVTGGSMN